MPHVPCPTLAVGYAYVNADGKCSAVEGGIKFVGLVVDAVEKWDKLPNWSRHIMIEEHRHGIYSRPCPKCGACGLDGWHATSRTTYEQKKRKTEWKAMCDVGRHCHDKL